MKVLTDLGCVVLRFCPPLEICDLVANNGLTWSRQLGAHFLSTHKVSAEAFKSAMPRCLTGGCGRAFEA